MNDPLIEVHPDELEEWAGVLSLICDWFAHSTSDTGTEFNEFTPSPLRFEQLKATLGQITVRMWRLAETGSRR